MQFQFDEQKRWLVCKNRMNVKITLNLLLIYGYLKIKQNRAMLIQETIRKIRFTNFLMHLLFWALSLVLFVVLIFVTRDFKLQAMNFQMAVNIFVTLLFIAVSV